MSNKQLSQLKTNILALNCIQGIGNKTILNLIKENSFIKDKVLNIEDFRQLLNSKSKKLSFPKQNAISSHIDKVIEYIEKDVIKITDITEQTYPAALKNIFNPPALLFYKGDINYDYNRSIAVVGTRKYSKYGEKACADFVKHLTEHKFTIVSGLAAGIDSISHKQTLAQKGKCIGVIGQGLDHIYPPSNKPLYDAVLDSGGGIISEFVPWQIPYPAFFPLRNRIIAGLARATLVIEAAQKSGSLITAKSAFDESREVYAIPSDIGFKDRQGCNQIIKDQIAKLIIEPQDIIKDLGIQNTNNIDNLANLSALPPFLQEIMKILSIEPYSSEELADKLNKEIYIINSMMSELELEGLIDKNNRGKWICI